MCPGSQGIPRKPPASPRAAKGNFQRLWRPVLRNLAVAFLLSIVLALGALAMSTFLPDFPLVAYLRYWRGYPWLPAIILSIGLVSLSAVAGSYLPLREWASNDALPPFIRLILMILSIADPELFPTPVWWSLVASVLFSFIGLWFFPQCISRNDILVSLKISKGGAPIAILSPGETATIEPGVTVRLEAEIEPVSREMDLPVLECTWEDAGIGANKKLDHTIGCTVDYQIDQTESSDAVSMQLTQWRCPSLASYPFFVERGP